MHVIPCGACGNSTINKGPRGGTARGRNDRAGISLVELECGNGVAHIIPVLEDMVKAPACPCGDVGMTVVLRPIYVGLDGKKIFVLFFVESELF